MLTDPSEHTSGIVDVDGIGVHYLDWGGVGDAVVLIAGMGNSAHVFDQFAPRLTDRFRVLGVTRVGFGESDQPADGSGYDLSSRVAHICAVLDVLRIGAAFLIGHSLGGDEITAFAVKHPERSHGLVYLDAAIDHSKAVKWDRELKEYVSDPPAPDRTDLASPIAYQSYLRRMRGVEFPIGEVLATNSFDSSGVVQGPRAAPQAYSAIMDGAQSPDFESVRSPALALYSDLCITDALPWLDNDVAQRADAAFNKQIRPKIEAERRKFAQHIDNAEVFAYPAHHYQFLDVPEDTEHRIRRFLSTQD